MFFKQIRCGGDRNFGYLIADEETRQCALVDPSPDPEPALGIVQEQRFKIICVIVTHDHLDHTSGNRQVQALSNAKSVYHSSTGKGDIQVNDGDSLSLGGLDLRFIHTPGHTEDGICILVEDCLVTGDTLFVGKVGGTYGREAARKEFESLKRLMELPDETTVWPGHDYGLEPSSTIGKERETNPFCLRLNDFDAFCLLKDNWADYKREHGIP